MSKRPSSTYNDPGYFYNPKKLLKLFTLTSVLLAVGIIAMVWKDWARPWKDTQRAAMRWEARRLSVEEMILERRSKSTARSIAKARRAAEKEVAKNRKAIEAVEKKIAEWRGAFYLRDMIYKERKQYTLEAEYKIHEVHDPDELEEWTRKLFKFRDDEARFKDAVRHADSTLRGKLAERAELESALAAVEARRAKDPQLKRLALVRQGIEKNRHWSFLRELPLLDFLAPPTKVEQLVLDNIVENYEFAFPKKVDRCGTCHVNAFRVGFDAEKFPRPLDDKKELDGNQFELAVYRFVSDSIAAVTPKDKPEKLRAVEIHHQTLSFMWAEYDAESGEIGLDGGKKKWQKYKRNKKGLWAKTKKGGASIGEYYRSVLNRMENHWRTHPHFDDMVGPGSAHPYEKVGCTVCHLGRGWSTDFGLAHHTPDRKKVEDWMTTERAEKEGHHLPLSAKMSLTEAMGAGRSETEADIATGWLTDQDVKYRWADELGRNKGKLKYWIWPQYPKMLIQASCLKCHKAGMLRPVEEEYAGIHIGKPDAAAPDVREWGDHAAATSVKGEAIAASRIFIPKKPERYRPKGLESGKDSFLRFGCYGCHKLDATVYPFMDRVRAKVGPPLDEIVSKVNDSWLEKWISDPKSFRPDTRMPRFFDLSNNSHEFQYRFADGNFGKIKGKLWNQTEIWAIAAWMKAESKKRARKLPTVDLSRGDPARGERLVIGDHDASKPGTGGDAAKGEAKACIACHDIGIKTDALKFDAAALKHEKNKLVGSTGWGARMSRRQGPTLTALGSKVKPEWLYAWLRNPRGWWKHTNMPDLRLTEQEALDIAAYLMTLRSEEFENSPAIVRDRSVLQKMAIELKVAEQKEATDRAITTVTGWSVDEQAQYVGKTLFKHYGCFGCHDIHAFQDATPIGAELTEWASKPMERLEINHAPIEHSHFDFIYAKLRNPRIYDYGMPRRDKPYERLRMPRFGFTADEARDIGTFVIALVNDPITPAARFNPDARDSAIIRGREIIGRYNCQACHIIEGEGGDIWPVIKADKWRPPNLLGQGIKTQPSWLFHFMKDPAFVSISDASAPGGIVPGSDRVRPWHSIRMPTFGLSDEEARAVVKYFAALSRAPADFETMPTDTLTGDGTSYATPRIFPVKREDDPTKTISITARNRLDEARAMFQQYQCKSCHSIDAKIDSQAPNFRHTRAGRLRPEWIALWLWNPNSLQEGTSMPGFFVGDHGEPKAAESAFLGGDAEQQIRALRDFVTRHYK